jgi:hypothetical protein
MTARYLARVNQGQKLFYFTLTGVEPLRCRVLSGGTLVSSSALVASANVEGLYVTEDEITFTTVGDYQVIIQQQTGISWSAIDTVPLWVTTDPTSSLKLPVQDSTVFVVPMSNSVSGLDVECKFITVDDEILDEGTAAYNEDSGFYEFSFNDAIADECNLFLYTLVDGTPTIVPGAAYLQLFNTLGEELCQFEVVDNSGVITEPLDQTTVLVSNTTGTPVRQGVTNALGVVNLSLRPGSYVVSLRRTSTVFSKNNFSIRVDSGVDNNFVHNTPYFEPTFSEERAVATTCNVYATLLRMNSLPLIAATVIVRCIDNVTQGQSYAVMGSTLTFTTDANGYVSMNLVRGVTVELFVSNTNIRRKFVVPSSTSANLFSITALEQDAYAPVTIPVAAVRRDL